jgi:hypothetical protein
MLGIAIGIVKLITFCNSIKCSYFKKGNLIYNSMKISGGSLVTTAWRVLRLPVEGSPLVTGVAANILNKQSRTADKGWSSSLGLGVGLTTPHRKHFYCCEMFERQA